MADETPKLKLPLIAASQAQKHITHNEALAALDALVQLSIDGEGTAPPAEPLDRGRYLVKAPASGAWIGQDGQVALHEGGGWQFFSPQRGWTAWFAETATLKVFDGIAWQDVAADIDAIDMLGINATADDVNRLVVASQASLFNHVGNGHQVKVNKATAGDTASVLFQTNWSGRAEMGLAGDNDFSIKVSDGTDWFTALRISQNGVVSAPQRPMVTAFGAAGVFSPPANTESGFTLLNPVQGGFSLGAATGTAGNRLRVPKSGTYLVTMNLTVLASSSHQTVLRRNSSVVLCTLYAPATVTASISHTLLANLEAGDELSLTHTGTSQILRGSGFTDLTVMMI